MGEGTVATETEAIFYHVIVVISLSSAASHTLLFAITQSSLVLCCRFWRDYLTEGLKATGASLWPGNGTPKVRVHALFGRVQL